MVPGIEIAIRADDLLITTFISQCSISYNNCTLATTFTHTKERLLLGSMYVCCTPVWYGRGIGVELRWT